MTARIAIVTGGATGIGLATTRDLAIRIQLAPSQIKGRIKLLSWHHGVNLNHRILLCINARVTVHKIKETHLRHRCIPTARSPYHHTALRSELPPENWKVTEATI